MNGVKAFQLKQQVKDLIAGREVKAALFYTFNFSPRFFENYVMPLLVPTQRFINNEIANHIVWRNLYKEKRVPPVTVYFDQDAKDTDSGPMLDYTFTAVRMPGAGRSKGNFHPKNSFILVENERGEEELIVLTGSNNITQNGWCENLECVAQLVLNPNKYYPAELCKSLREFIEQIIITVGSGTFSEAEERIYKSLNRYNAGSNNAPLLYHSLMGYSSFGDFLREQVFSKAEIHLVEIQSPFFSGHTALVDALMSAGMKVKIQAPMHQGTIQLDQLVYEQYLEKGVVWTVPDDEKRNSHRKTYRFHANDRHFTVVGSINFTQPAWRRFTAKPKHVSNIESALVFEKKVQSPEFLLGKALRKEQLRFQAPSTAEELREERETVPDIRFEMDWTNRKLSWTSRATNSCTLTLGTQYNVDVSTKGHFSFPDNRHGEILLDSLARKPLLTVIEQIEQRQVSHYYYMSQIGFGQRPSQFHITPSDMIDAWELLGKDDEIIREWFENTIEHIVDLLQDESGRIDPYKPETKSLLNDMARQFYGLTKLEDILFDERQLKGSEKARQRHFHKIDYYLASENVDTLISYIRGLEKLYQNGNLMHSFYWLLLQIVRTRFYEHPSLKQLIRTCAPAGTGEAKTFQKVIEQRLSKLEELSRQLEEKPGMDKKILSWTLKNLQMPHVVS
ncbi:MAG: hypothetical protein RLZZ630_482 [Bacteroidota bacterium]|jgi:HKD family nuclease